MTGSSYKSARRASRSGDILFNATNTLLLCLLVFVTLYPFWNTVAVSFNDGLDSIRGGIRFWPRIFSLQNYKAVFATGTVYRAFLISVARTVLTMVIGVFLTAMYAYTLSRKGFVLAKVQTVLIVISMYVNAGMIPIYFLIKNLHLLNNFWVYVIPGLVNGFNFIVIRTYMKGLPESYYESAQIDGAGDFMIFIRIIFPLCKPVLATIALFIAVGAWNSWFDTLLYCSGHSELHTLQYKLMEYLQSSQNQAKSAADIASMGMSESGGGSMVTPVSIRAAISVVAAVPILVVYPFMQRYFVVGLNVGGVKE